MGLRRRAGTARGRRRGALRRPVGRSGRLSGASRAPKPLPERRHMTDDPSFFPARPRRRSPTSGRCSARRTERASDRRIRLDPGRELARGAARSEPSAVRHPRAHRGGEFIRRRAARAGSRVAERSLSARCGRGSRRTTASRRSSTGPGPITHTAIAKAASTASTAAGLARAATRRC